MKKNGFKYTKKVFIFLLIVSWLFSGWPPLWQRLKIFPTIQPAYASVSITQATGGTSISADTTGGSYTTLTGPTITEGTSGDIQATGTIVLSAPSGFVYNTAAAVTATITKDGGTKTCFTFTSTTATPTTNTITFTANAGDGTGGTKCHVTFSNIQVRPSAGTPLASGNITNTGTNTGVPSGTVLGTLTEVTGTKNKLAITQQPSGTAGISTDFTTKPVVVLQDQFGNTLTGDSSSTITESAVLSTQSCGGTAGSGSITSAPSSGAAVTNGVMTYTAMQYSAAESIKICFSSSGVTSALSNTINVAVISVTISSGTITYGILSSGASKDTTSSGLNNTQSAQNNSTITENFNIKGQNSANWTLAGSAGTNQYAHKFCISGTGTPDPCDANPVWTALSTSYQTLASNVPASGTQRFDLQLIMPSSTTFYTQQSVDVTVQATTP